VSICFALALASAQAATDTASTIERKLTLPDGVPMPVSIISITPNSALVADYWQITEIHLNSRTARTVPPVFPRNISSRIYHPTGLFFHKNQLLVANYVGKNILIGSIEPGVFSIQREIRDADMQGPENVAADDENIVVADYVAEKIFCFNLRGRKKWARPLPLAHGVHLLGNTVFASSLGGGGVVRLDLASGEVVGAPSLDWRYPTHIGGSTPPFPGDIFVVDANRGAIKFLTKALQPLSTLAEGSALPWQRPYGSTIVGNVMLIADTENRRILRVSANGKLSTVHEFENRKLLGSPVRRGNLGNDDCSFQRVTYTEAPPQAEAFGGFGTLCLARNSGVYGVVVLPVKGYLQNRPEQPLGFVWGTDVVIGGESYTVYGSSNRSQYLVKAGLDFSFVKQGRDFGILGPQGSAEVEGVIRRIAESGATNIKQLRQTESACGRIGGFLLAAGVYDELGEALRRAASHPFALKLIDAWIAGASITPEDIARYKLGGQVALDDLAILDRLVDTSFAPASALYNGCRASEGRQQ